MLRHGNQPVGFAQIITRSGLVLIFHSVMVPLAVLLSDTVGRPLGMRIEVLASMSTVRPHPATGLVEQQAVPRIYTCNRLGRHAELPSRGWALANWWRRATRRCTGR